MRLRLWILAALAVALAFPAGAALRKDADEPASAPAKKEKKDEIGLFSDVLIEAGRSIPGDALAICGNVDVDGAVGGRASSFFGDATIDGSVKGAAAAIMGDLILGPNARIDGDAICIGGVIRRDPGAIVRGRVIVRTMGSGLRLPHGLARHWSEGFHFSGFWIVALFMAVVGGFFSLVSPRGVRACGAALAGRPAASLIAALVATAVFPFVFVLLSVSLVGLPLAVTVLPLLAVILWLFGLAVLFARFGLMVTTGHASLASGAMLGGLVLSALFLVPLVGSLVFLFLSWLAVGAVMLSLYEAVLRQPASH